MTLTTLQLRNFRSYEKATFQFSPSVTLIIGPNTSGKTNILEAIMMMATGKSFRADMDREAIAWGNQLSVVSCQLSDGNEETKLELFITQGEVQGAKAPLKKYLVNGVARRHVDFVGNLRAVLFWPEHLALVTDSPNLRRRYLDSVLVQVDREYRRNLQSYERGLRQRNRLLDFINEGTAHRHQLLFWDQLLIKAGGYITDKREEYIDYVNTYAISDKKASDKKEQSFSLLASRFSLSYDKSVISESRLEQYKEEEVAAKATLVGPHRDNFVIAKYQVSRVKYHEKHVVTSDTLTHDTYLDLSKYGSRGEQRLAILWLKLAELRFIKERFREASSEARSRFARGSGSARPILLLDDIFSELDATHRHLVYELIGRQQTIITSADEEVLHMLGKNKHRVAIIKLPVVS